MARGQDYRRLASLALGLSVRIALCIASCRRPRWLAASLESLRGLIVEGEGTELHVIVVDNDPDGTARGPFVAAQHEFPWRLSYDIEPRRGISFARNRAVHLALSWGADQVAFLDDDETVSPRWLAEMLLILDQYGADIVTGPVVPSYEPGVAKWVIEGGFFQRPRHQSGALLDSAITANCLIGAEWFSASVEPFHPAFALSGGGDTHFFQQAHAKGAKIVWADAAVVYESIPASRATVRWLLHRAYRGGASCAISERLLHRTPTRMIRRACIGTIRGLQGLALLLPSAFQGRAGIIRALRTGFAGAGMLSGILGLSTREYTVIHGR